MGTPKSDQMLGSEGERLGELSSRVCYDSLGKGRSSEAFHKHILEVKHLSVHAHYHETFIIYFDATIGDAYSYSLCLSNNPWASFTILDKWTMRITANPRVVLEWKKHGSNQSRHYERLGEILTYAFSKLCPNIVTQKFDEVASLVLPNCYDVIEPENPSEKWVSLYLTGSRGFSHEMVRHGTNVGISQRSTRYCDESESSWILHPLLVAIFDKGGEDLYNELNDAHLAAINAYKVAVDSLETFLKGRGVDKATARKQARGAARGFLGNALQTEMIYTANIPQWKHILNMRCSPHADAEIREVCCKALGALKRSRYSAEFEDMKLEPAADGIGEVLVGSS